MYSLAVAAYDPDKRPLREANRHCERNVNETFDYPAVFADTHGCTRCGNSPALGSMKVGLLRDKHKAND